jgi:transcriptional regulator with XRE-family HTH domain
LERGFGQDELALARRRHVNHISFLERGMCVPSLLVIFQIAGALQIPIADLVARIEAQVGGVPRSHDQETP